MEEETGELEGRGTSVSRRKRWQEPPERHRVAHGWYQLQLQRGRSVKTGDKSKGGE